MTYRIAGLPPSDFAALFSLSNRELQDKGIAETIADDDRYPCRVSLTHAPVGDRLLLLNYMHQPVPGPYRASHAIYVSESATTAGQFIDCVPPMIAERQLSLRAFDHHHMMIDAKLVDGCDANQSVIALLDNPAVDYLHIHFAVRGCFAAKVERG